MNADQVRAFVASKWPKAMQSPLAQAVGAVCAADEAALVRSQLLADAVAHADACVASCGGWTVETLGHNVESAFGMDLGADECDEIAAAALLRARH